MITAPAHFVGRERQLRTLAAAADHARANTPDILWIEGDAGIGKTTLVRQALTGRSFDGFIILKARCDSSESDYSYGVIEQLVAPIDLELRRRHELLAGQISAQLTPVAVGSELLSLLSDVQESGPTVVVVDDAHWIDRASLQALRFLIRRLEADSVIVMLVTRPQADVEMYDPIEDIGKLVRDHGGHRIYLRGLRIDETKRLADLGGTPVRSSIVERLQELTDGHPLYLETLLQQVSLDVLEHPDELPIPQSLAKAVNAQLGSLPDDARRLAEACAVLGARAPLATAARVAGLSDGAAALDALQSAGLVDWRLSGPIGYVQIRHSLQREAVLMTVEPSRLRALHLTAADAVDSYSSWQHRVAASDGTDADLASELENASALLVEEGDLGRAATLLTWACELTADRKQSERLLLNAAIRLQMSFRFAQYSHLRARVERCLPGSARDLVMGWTAMIDGDLQRARVLMTSTLEAEDEDAVGHKLALVSLAILSDYEGDGQLAIEMARRILAMPGLDPQSAALGKEVLAFGTTFLHGPGAGIRMLHELGLPERPGDVGPQDVICLAWRAVWRALSGELVDAATDARRALDLSRNSRISGVDECAHFALALSHFLQGSWDSAITQAEQSSAIALAEEKVWSYAFGHLACSMVFAGRGDAERAEGHVQEIANLVSVRWPPQYAVFSATARGFLAQSQDDPSRMLEAFQQLLALPGPLDGRPRMFAPLWLPLLCEAQLRNDRLADAESSLAELEALDARHLEASKARLRGLLAERRGTVDEALRHYLDGQAAAATCPVPLDQALLEIAHARLLTALGRAEESRQLLARARTRLTEIGALAYLRQAGVDGGTGPEPQPSPDPRGLPALTPREREISGLVGRGLTNNEIATELFVTAKTVEYHLSHVYAKLHVPGRRALRDLVAG